MIPVITFAFAGAEVEHDRQLDVGTVEPLESYIRRNIVDVNSDTNALLIVAGYSLGTSLL